MYQGIGASAGIGIGKAVLIRQAELDWSGVVFQGAAAEKERLHKAIAAFIDKTNAMADAMRARVGEKQAEILTGQVLMVGDPFMSSQMEENIDRGLCAEAAVDGVCAMYIDMFSQVEDELTRQRASDVKDLRARLISILMGKESVDLASLPAGSILVAHDFTPSMTAGIQRQHVEAVVTEVGGVTSHSAILARTMELPAALSVPGIMSAVQDGDTLVVDGGEGQVLVNPDPAVVQEYRERQARLAADKAALAAYRDRPTLTADGQTRELFCNIGSPKDTEKVLEATGEGIGLFRTEFLFMDRASLPTEEEQFEAYRQVAQAMGGREVIIRTLDVGGDKEIPYLGMEKEDNPFLGFRAIRYCLQRREMFTAQLRALLRASAYGKVKIMLPLVTCIEELRQTRALLGQLKEELAAQDIPFDRDIKLGVMIETPAAALISDLLAREADFFSIGTNDLTQYTMAVDRGNSAVAYLYSPLQPAVLRSIRTIIRNGREAGIPVGMCGEAAADPLMIPLLIAFGLTEFSVSATSVLATRRAIASWSQNEAERLAEEVMALSDSDGIKAYLKAAVSKH